jgi:hypothetical protein
MQMGRKLEHIRRRKDFRVKYKWIESERAEIRQSPFQFMRCDFAYEGDDVTQSGVYMILPEFENAEGKSPGKDELIPAEGVASMWIMNEELRKTIHRERIQPGVQGYFMVGRICIAKVEVIELVELAQE